MWIQRKCLDEELVWVSTCFEVPWARSGAGASVGDPCRGYRRFLRARADSTLRRIVPAARRAVVASGLPLTWGFEPKRRSTCSAVSQTLSAGREYALGADNRRPRSRKVGESHAEGVPIKCTRGKARFDKTGGFANRPPDAHRLDGEVAEIARNFYGYELPWIIHAASSRCGGRRVGTSRYTRQN